MLMAIHVASVAPPGNTTGGAVPYKLIGIAGWQQASEVPLKLV